VREWRERERERGRGKEKVGHSHTAESPVIDDGGGIKGVIKSQCAALSLLEE